MVVAARDDGSEAGVDDAGLAPPAAQQVEADDLRDVRVTGPGDDLGGGALLHDAAVLDEDEVVGEGQGVERVVGDQDGGPVVGAQPRREPGADLGPQRRVEGREGLVEEEEARPGGQGSGQRDPLGLAVREGRRPAVGEVEDPEGVELGVGPGEGAGLRRAPAARPERDVAAGREVREEEVVGGEHPDGAQARVEVAGAVGPRLAVDPDVTVSEPHEAGQRVDGGRLPGAVRAEHGDDPAVGGGEGDVEVEGTSGEPDVGVEAHRTHRPRRRPRTTTATTRSSRLRATAVCGSSWSLT